MPIMAVAIGRVIDDNIELSETYFVKIIVASQTIAAIPTTFGHRTINTPVLVATPFPPLNFRNTGHIWPITAANAEAKTQ